MTSKTIATALSCIRESESVVSGSGETVGSGRKVGCVCGRKVKLWVSEEFAERVWLTTPVCGWAPPTAVEMICGLCVEVAVGVVDREDVVMIVGDPLSSVASSSFPVAAASTTVGSNFVASPAAFLPSVIEVVRTVVLLVSESL